MRITMLSRIFVLVIALTGGDLANATDEMYIGAEPPMTVVIDNSIALVAADNERSVPLKIFYPREQGPFPLIVLSHGTFSSIDRYDLIANYWAAQGYVVILPQHIDANYGVTPSGYDVMQNVSLTRVADMSQVLDELDDIVARLPALAGKIERGRYIAAGHSIGTQVAMLVTGLRYRTDFNATVMAADENRFSALLLVSDPGKMRLMPTDLWTASNVPTFMATGTDDYGLMGQRGAATEAQSEVLRASDSGDIDRYLLLLEGGDHYFGGLIQKQVDAQPDHEGLAIFNAVSTAFMDAYIKNSAPAKRYLVEVDMAVATDQRATLERLAP